VSQPQYPLLAAGSHQLVVLCPPWQWLPLLSQKLMDPLLSQKQMDLFPPLHARTREEKQEDCKWILSVCNNTDIWQFNKAANSYLEDSTTCAFHLRTTRRPCGIEGRVSVNSTDGQGELSLLASPSASFSARRLPPLVDSLLCRASATRALFASATALGRRWSDRGMSGCGG
jgi:hypothetical protein